MRGLWELSVQWMVTLQKETTVSWLGVRHRQTLKKKSDKYCYDIISRSQLHYYTPLSVTQIDSLRKVAVVCQRKWSVSFPPSSYYTQGLLFLVCCRLIHLQCRSTAVDTQQNYHNSHVDPMTCCNLCVPQKKPRTDSLHQRFLSSIHLRMTPGRGRRSFHRAGLVHIC